METERIPESHDAALPPAHQDDPSTTAPAAEPEKGAIGIALVVWLLGGGLGLAVLVFLMAKAC